MDSFDIRFYLVKKVNKINWVFGWTAYLDPLVRSPTWEKDRKNDILAWIVNIGMRLLVSMYSLFSSFRCAKNTKFPLFLLHLLHIESFVLFYFHVDMLSIGGGGLFHLYFIRSYYTYHTSHTYSFPFEHIASNNITNTAEANSEHCVMANNNFELHWYTQYRRVVPLSLSHFRSSAFFMRCRFVAVNFSIIKNLSCHLQHGSYVNVFILNRHRQTHTHTHSSGSRAIVNHGKKREREWERLIDSDLVDCAIELQIKLCSTVLRIAFDFIYWKECELKQSKAENYFNISIVIVVEKKVGRHDWNWNWSWSDGS